MRKNKEFIKTYVLGNFFYLLDKTENCAEMKTACKAFCGKYFPDVLEDYKKYKHECVDLKRKCILFGAGHEMSKAVQTVGEENIIYIVDNNPLLEGKVLNGIRVHSFKYLNSHYNSMEESIIITSYRYCYDIARQLWENHIFGFWMARDIKNVGCKSAKGGLEIDIK